jgi:integrase
VRQRELRSKAEQGIDLEASRITVGDFLTRWLEDVVRQRNKTRTHESYEQLLTKHVIPRIGKVLLPALKPGHIQRLLNDLTKQRLSARTVTYIRAIVQRALNQAVLWRYVQFNAASLVTPPRAKKHTVEPLTREEARKLLDALKGHRLEALYTAALLLGLRRGEVPGLLIANLDLECGTVRIDGALQWQRGKLVRDSVKTASSVRILPVPATLVPLLREHLERQQERYPDNEYVFASTTGTPINPRNLLRQFKEPLKKAGLRDIRFHDLRHSCATFLIASGVHPRTIMQVLGHSQISTTLNIYGHVLNETQAAAIEGIDRLLSGDVGENQRQAAG